MENNNFIKECFEILKKKHPEKFLMNKNPNNKEIELTDDNIDKKINYFEKKYNIKYPDLYKSFLENYTQHLKLLEGSIIFKIKTMKIKLYFWRISDLAKKYEKYKKIINKGYIPFGNNNDKIFTLNTKYNNVITTFESKNINDNNWEEYYYDMFENFEVVLECFFKDNYYKHDRTKLDYMHKDFNLYSKAVNGDIASILALGNKAFRWESDWAEKWYKKAAALGSIDGEKRLGMLYYKDKNYKKAFEKSIPLADKGIYESAHIVAEMYLKGIEVEKDINKAIKYYEIAAEEEIEEDLLELGKLYINYTEDKKQEGIKIVKEIADTCNEDTLFYDEFDETNKLPGNNEEIVGEANSVMGSVYLQNKEIEKAYKYYYNATELGTYRTYLKDKEYRINFLLQKIRFEKAQNIEIKQSGLRCLEEEAKIFKNSDAAYMMAEFYEKGINVEQNLDKAQKYHEISEKIGPGKAAERYKAIQKYFE